MTRPLRFSRWGLAENPAPAPGRRGYFVTWRQNGRDMLGEVRETYRREFPACIMLRIRHFDGSDAGDVAAGAVRVIE